MVMDNQLARSRHHRNDGSGEGRGSSPVLMLGYLVQGHSSWVDINVREEY